MRIQVLFAAVTFAAGVFSGSGCGGETAQSGPQRDAGAGSDSGLTPADGGADGGTMDDGAQDAGKDTGADAGTNKDGGPADAGNVDAPRLDPAATIAEVALYQGVKTSLGGSGGPVAQRNASVVAGRESLVRVFVDPGGSAGRQVSCEVVVKSGASKSVFSGTASISGASTDGSLSSTCNVTVPGTSVSADAAISARLVSANAAVVPAGSAHPARFPADGSYLDLDAGPSGGPIRLVLVPMKYDTDGSGRLPDTGPQVLGMIERLFTTAYPADRLEITVRDALPWSEEPTWGGGVDFNKLNQLMADTKERDGAESGAYYFGMIRPAATFAEYCAWVCVAGQGWVVDDPSDGAIRAASGVAFDADQAAWTCAHEVGHLHGRYHAPCSTMDSDGSYPYSGGKIGVWGWDRSSNVLYSPDQYTDFMGYCEDQWVSDYTWNGLFKRIQAVNALPPPPAGPGRAVRFLDVMPDGSHRWGMTVSLRTPPRGTPLAVDLLDDTGARAGTTIAALFRHAHGGGVTLLVDARLPGTGHLVFGGAPGVPAVRIPVEH
ncbi:MAG: hypothetical protein HY897_02815 [Deltaproteobacteria bacterium]|nr:hypothetical protein [Deltaproteobacteria bacterium]